MAVCAGVIMDPILAPEEWRLVRHWWVETGRAPSLRPGRGSRVMGFGVGG